ncbi:MAG: DUF4286 family protein [Paludibacteraceae bacterium]|nr:DUF4286 family protein [Candidatus Physcocola equi]MCQ2233127.1 DUF4286 family protein [Paludibacteraceae bacterium]
MAETYIINTTYAVSEQLSTSWKKWVMETLIPAAYTTGVVTDHHIYRVMSAAVDKNDHSYCVQLTTDINGVRLWKKSMEKDMQHLVAGKYGTMVLGFSTILKSVD